MGLKPRVVWCCCQVRLFRWLTDIREGSKVLTPASQQSEVAGPCHWPRPRPSCGNINAESFIIIPARADWLLVHRLGYRLITAQISSFQYFSVYSQMSQSKPSSRREELFVRTWWVVGGVRLSTLQTGEQQRSGSNKYHLQLRPTSTNNKYPAGGERRSAASLLPLTLSIWVDIRDDIWDWPGWLPTHHLYCSMQRAVCSVLQQICKMQ